MNLFTTPKRWDRGDVVLAIVVSLVVCLLAPDQEFENRDGGWVLGLAVVLPFSFVAGLFSSWIYYRNHKLTSVDPFYLRAWWGLIGGAVVWPVCLLFRPIAADFSFIIFTFGLGPVIAYHLYHRIQRRKAAL